MCQRAYPARALLSLNTYNGYKRTKGGRLMSEKYPINKEFGLLKRFVAPMNPHIITVSKAIMGVPRYVWNDPDVSVEERSIAGHLGGEVELLIMRPAALGDSAPCLIDIHGGGFVFEAAPYHYRLALEYAKQARCVVVFVIYRLAPEFPFPYPQEDCYAAVKWVFDNAKHLKVDPARIGIGGDSAGGTLTVTSCMMLRDRGDAAAPLFQLLIYPWLDGRNNSQAYRAYTDVPVWNSSISKKVEPLINPDPEATPLAYRSPAEAENFKGLPPAYIEVAEFDSLHDDGVLYAQLLRDEQIPVEFHETHGTIHGFDAIFKAPTTQEMLAKRIAFMRRMFGS